MSISHAPPSSPRPDMSLKYGTEEAIDLVPLRPASSRRASLPRWLRRTAGPLLLLALWQVLSGTGLLAADALASPGRIAEVGWGLVADGSLTSAMGTSLRRVAAGPSPSRRRG